MNLQALGDLEQVESVRSPGSYIPSNGEEKSLETTAKVLLLRVLLHANVLFLQEAQLPAENAGIPWHSMINKCTDAVCPLIG